MTVTIYGAGMAGLLAAQMLRRLSPEIYERQTTLPDNHGALLRFRSDAVARETGVPFRKVRVLKAVMSGGRLRPVSTLADANQYSFKVTGAVEPRSVLNLDPCDRFIAPPDFLSTMASGARITLGREMVGLDLHELKDQTENTIISTIPMPVLMEIAGWPKPPRFDFRAVWSITVDVTAPLVDVHQTVYYPEADAPYYRASMTGSRLIIEFMKDPNLLPDRENRTTRAPAIPAIVDCIRSVMRDFGLPGDDDATYIVTEPKKQHYGKLLPIDDRARQEFILAMTDEFNVYSVGRFATWRQILLDDVVSDVRTVERMITQRSAYTRRLSSVKR